MPAPASSTVTSLAALAVVGCAGSPAALPSGPGLIVIDAVAELDADGRRAGPLRLRAAAAPEPPQLLAGGCWSDELRGAPVAAGLGVDLGAPVLMPWQAEVGRHEAILAVAPEAGGPAGDAAPRIWADLSWREAAVFSNHWRRPGALRFADAPRAGRYLVEPLGQLRLPGEADHSALSLIVRVDGAEQRCPLGGPAHQPPGLDLRADHRPYAVFVEHLVQQRVELPDGRPALVRGRLRSPLGLPLPSDAATPELARPPLISHPKGTRPQPGRANGPVAM